MNGQITLRATPGGFGTPPFGSTERQIRVEGADLVVSQYRTETVQEPDHEPGPRGGAGRHPARARAAGGIRRAALRRRRCAGCRSTPHAAEALADWFALAFEVLTEFLDECRAEDEPSPHVRLWPEHFDAAVDVGTGDRGGTYGLSPGDRYDPHPYVYASRWGDNAPDPFYDSPFGGAWLPYADVVAAPDPRAAVLGFLREARRRRLGY